MTVALINPSVSPPEHEARLLRRWRENSGRLSAVGAPAGRIVAGVPAGRTSLPEAR